MTSKTIDCVKMKRQGAELVHRLTKDMTVEEEVEFWRVRTEELRQEQRRLLSERDKHRDPRGVSESRRAR